MSTYKFKGRLRSVTDEIEVGKNKLKKFELLIKQTNTYNDEIFETWLAVQVFPRDGKNTHDSFLHLIEQVVEVTFKLGSTHWESNGRDGWATNVTFKKIEKVENTFSKKVSTSEKSATAKLFDNEKIEDAEIVSENEEAQSSEEEKNKKLILPVDGESLDDLPF